jgi:hypothetical protein
MPKDELMEFARHLGQQAENEEFRQVLAEFSTLTPAQKSRALFGYARWLIEWQANRIAELEAKLDKMEGRDARE